uniref:Small ribosomal subunit protein uS3c n=1 Tax=Trichomanes trollii TaxID=1481379 RepID=A0A410YET1_9MONI|nr:ribosomal protein S3 [Trichomanes trollii]QAV57697.1 ribosomal protein S3 [Trichomanes trollii]
MGRKIHPLGFRLGVNQKHYSYWFAQTKDYPRFLKEDKEIRTLIEKYVQKRIENSSDYGGIAHIGIQRKTDLINIEICTGFPDLLIEERNLGIDQLKSNIAEFLNFKVKDHKVQIILNNIAQPYGEPRILAEHIASQLENRVAFRRTMKKAIELAKRTSNRGIKIQIAGRLNGNEMARTEWAREGRVPLQTIRAPISYCYHPAQTIYGVLGIKVWIFKDIK